MNNRRDFFKGLLSFIPAALLTDLHTVVENRNIRKIDSFIDLMSMNIEREIDYEMIKRIVNITTPEVKVPPYKEAVEGVDYIFTKAFYETNNNTQRKF